MVNNFNQLRETAVNNSSSDRGAQNLQSRLDNISQAFGTSLARVGITQNDHGYWQINQERLASAISDGTAENVLGGNATITQRVNQVARAADENTNSFIARENRTPANNAPNENFFDSIRLNPFQQNFNNHWNTVGMRHFKRTRLYRAMHPRGRAARAVRQRKGDFLYRLRPDSGQLDRRAFPDADGVGASATGGASTHYADGYGHGHGGRPVRPFRNAQGHDQGNR
jgi:hypothetical protein